MRLTKEQKDTIYPSIIKEFLEDEVITLQGLAKCQLLRTKLINIVVNTE